ncbi:MAG: gephyrin-like molybdotransferase Glp [Planctomycetota bacterium]
MVDDPRMRGFRSRTAVEDVITLIDQRVGAGAAERVALDDARERVLADDVIATVNVPAFARSAMDGYAVVAEQTFGATPDDPREFAVADESLPAKPAAASVTAKECVRIMTGAPLPEGADAVVPVEMTAAAGDDRVNVTGAVTPGQHVGAIGEDIATGDRVLERGRRLRAQDLGVCSSIGEAELNVVTRPRVAVLITGNEILPPGSKPSGHSIVDANSPMLRALIERDGGVALKTFRVEDNVAALSGALLAAVKSAKCVLVSGGTSVGAEDHMPKLVAKAGELIVHGVAMRPSSPAGLGFVKETPVFLLPGNPVSCLCAYDFFAGRAIRRLGGLPEDFPHEQRRLPLERKIASQLGRTDYVRVRIENDRVVPLAIRGASRLSSTTRADGFVIVPAALEGYAEGDKVTVRLY